MIDLKGTEFTDIEPMTRDYIDEHQVVARYVNGQLSEQELSSFEMRFIDDPQLLDEIEYETALKAGLNQARARLEPQKQTAEPAGIFKWLTRPWLPIGLAAALGLSLANGVMLRSALEQQKRELSGPLNATFVDISSTRGGKGMVPESLDNDTLANYEITKRLLGVAGKQAEQNFQLKAGSSVILSIDVGIATPDNYLAQFSRLNESPTMLFVEKHDERFVLIPIAHPAAGEVLLTLTPVDGSEDDILIELEFKEGG